MQHLQNVAAPIFSTLIHCKQFEAQIVYDGHALAYSPSRPLPLAGNTAVGSPS